MAQRPKLGPLTPPPLPGAEFLKEYKAGMKGLFDVADFPLTGIGGTANDLTAALAWELDAGLIDGMKFTLTWAATNTGPMTLAINGAASVSLLDATGGAMLPGTARAGTRAMVEFIAGAFRVLVGADASAMDQRLSWIFTSSGTWTKPAGLSDDTPVTIELWGGGGGGAWAGPSPMMNGGGGGGGYTSRVVRLGDLPSSVAVGIGAGGAVNTAGGTTTFGVILSAFGGGCGSVSPGSKGGGGGGTAGGGGNAVGSTAGNGGLLGGGGGTSVQWPQGGGAGGPGGVDSVGGAAYLGGGGGSGGDGVGGGAGGGQSILAGSGGNYLAPGQAPAGGGGANAAGARGEVRIWI